MVCQIWVVDAKSVDKRKLLIVTEGTTVASFKKACVRDFKYSGSLYDPTGKIELVDGSADIMKISGYCSKKQMPLMYGGVVAEVKVAVTEKVAWNFNSRFGCSKTAASIWILTSIVAVGTYAYTHWAHLTEMYGDMPYIMNMRPM
jgi:hypothetical protein